jgi:hypothetical protein
MSEFQKLLESNSIWVSTYEIRPSKLFDGVDQRLLIILIDFNKKQITTSSCHRWYSEYREHLFNTLKYTSGLITVPNSITKIQNKIEIDIIKKLYANNKKLYNYFDFTGKFNLYYHNAPRYFIRAMEKTPYFWNEKEGEKISDQNKSLIFSFEVNRDIISSVLCSSIFYWWFIVQSDCRHLNLREINEFPLNIDSMHNTTKMLLTELSKKFEKDIMKNSYRKETNYKTTGKVIYDEFYPKKSKYIIDEIDKTLAQHYSFTEEELDFIINYDIKYRMGGELDNEEFIP